MRLLNTSSKYLGYIANNLGAKKVDKIILNNKIKHYLNNPKIINSCINGQEIPSIIIQCHLNHPPTILKLYIITIMHPLNKYLRKLSRYKNKLGKRTH